VYIVYLFLIFYIFFIIVFAIKTIKDVKYLNKINFSFLPINCIALFHFLWYFRTYCSLKPNLIYGSSIQMRSVTTGPQNAQWLPFGNDSDDNPDDNPAISRSHKHDPSTCNSHDFPLFAPGGGGGEGRRGVSVFRFRCNVSPAIMQMPALKWTDCSLQSAFK